jgi:hypothetical protein
VAYPRGRSARAAHTPAPPTDRRAGGSSLQGGLAGIAAVTLATIALALAGALIALVVSLLY